MISDGKDSQRPARFRDVAVLVRTLNALPPILEAFEEFGIPHLTEGGKTFHETREVRDLVLLLRVIANPRDEIALAGVLRSPLVGIGDETLLRMKLGGSLRLDGLEALSSDPEDLAETAPFRCSAGQDEDRARRRLPGPAALAGDRRLRLRRRPRLQGPGQRRQIPRPPPRLGAAAGRSPSRCCSRTWNGCGPRSRKRKRRRMIPPTWCA